MIFLWKSWCLLFRIQDGKFKRTACLSFFLECQSKRKSLESRTGPHLATMLAVSHTHTYYLYSHMHHLLSLNTDRQHSWSTHTRLNLLFLSITLGSAEACVNEPELQISMCIVNKMIVQWCAVNNNLNHSQIHVSHIRNHAFFFLLITFAFPKVKVGFFQISLSSICTLLSDTHTHSLSLSSFDKALNGIWTCLQRERERDVSWVA